MRIYHGDSINTLYAVLDLPETADQAEIKSARNRLIRKYHPDKIPTNFKGTRRDAEAKTRLIIEAYEVLGNNRERCQYDEWLSSQRSQPEPDTFDFSFDEEDTSSFSEDIEEEKEEEIPVQQKKKKAKSKAKSKTKKKSTRKTVKREQPFFSNTECTPDPWWKNIEPETYIAILIFVIYPAVTAGAK
jgi:DnaJ-class molecular chaperone